jgi:hypothetical protein
MIQLMTPGRWSLCATVSDTPPQSISNPHKIPHIQKIAVRAAAVLNHQLSQTFLSVQKEDPAKAAKIPPLPLSKNYFVITIS